MIYHIAHKESWESAADTGFYVHPSVSSEGFIHACSKAQLAGVRLRYYDGLENLTLLHIDETLVSAPIKYELSPSLNESFPHIYGKLNFEAVTNVEFI